MSFDRRDFLLTSAGLGVLNALPPVTARETTIDPNLVSMDSGIEPLVKILEDTPRERILEEIGLRIRKGLSYQELLTALFLAGVRNVQPRPTVGFKFHAVLMINSAHLASMAAPSGDRWLPILWSIDRFKAGQADTRKDSGWRMKPVNESRVPPFSRVHTQFIQAMENWDEEAADAATAAMARSAGMNELFDLYAGFGCRDFRDIGHKAIYVANAFRTLQVIGMQHAEPILRSLTYALLQHEGSNPAQRDGDPDRPGRQARERLKTMTGIWQGRELNPEMTDDLLAKLRTLSASEMTDQVARQLNGKTAARSIWDALFLGGAELLMRQPGIVALHSLTTLNALHYSFHTAADESTRKMQLLQAAAFVPLFRDAMKSRGKVGADRIDQLKPSDKPVTTEAIYATLTKDKAAAASLALKALNADPQASQSLADLGRKLIFLKGTDSHDYKFSSAVLEDTAAISAPYRARFQAASLYWLKGSESPDAPLVKRIRASL